MKTTEAMFIQLYVTRGVFWWSGSTDNMRYHQTLVNPGRFTYNHTVMVF